MKKNNIFVLVIFLTMILLTITYFIYRDASVKAPLVKDGYIDLSDWDFDKDGNVKLDGYWEFYPNVLLSPSDITDKLLPEKYFVNTPNPWEGQVPKSVISDKGIGTYRVRVKINKDIYMYGLKTTEIRSASRIFVNGEEVGKIGNPQSSFENGYFSNVQGITTCFQPEDDTLDIVIQVANLDYSNGGIIQSIYLGSDDKITQYYIISVIIDVLRILFLVVLGVCDFVVYFQNKKQKSFLYLGIICATYSYVTATINEKLFNKIFIFVPYIFSLKLKIILITLSIYLISLFIWENGKNLIKYDYIKMVKYTNIINVFLILVMPMKWLGIFEKILAIENVLICVINVTLIAIYILKQRQKMLKAKHVIFLLCIAIAVTFQYSIFMLYYFAVIKISFIPYNTFLGFLIANLAILLKYRANTYDKMEIMSENLASLNKLKDQFLIKTSHELKNPLHAIINIARTALDKSDRNTKKSTENISSIIATATRLSNLVNDIVDLQSMENGILYVNKNVFDINGTVQTVIDILTYLRKSEEVKLINNIEIGKYYVYTDENRFRQIIFDIIDNSLKNIEKGYIEIKAEIIEDYVNIIIEDTGKGIDKNYQNRIFDKNIHMERNAFINSSSTGINLSISKMLASRIGGDLYLKWSESNEGSVFIIKMPGASEDDKVVNQDKEINTDIDSRIIENQEHSYEHLIGNNSDAEKLKILLVDDDVVSIKVLRESFNDDTYETLVAYNGETALELVKKHKDISIILLDVMMPGLSGYDVCRKIRKEYKMFEIPILLLTVSCTQDAMELGFEVGANDFLAKPFNFVELKARVRTLQKMRSAVKDTLKLETVFLQSQIKPHFLYNALSVIVSLCHSDGKKAVKLLEELSKYLRFTFDINPYNSFISLKREISFVKSYIELEKARFGERLNVEFDLDEGSLEYSIPALIIQPLVENSIRHGVMKRISGGIVKISIKNTGQYIKVVIQDNGVGINSFKLKELTDDDISKNSALRNVNKRLINEYGHGLSIDSIQGKGTVVTINLPLKLEIEK